MRDQYNPWEVGTPAQRPDKPPAQHRVSGEPWHFVSVRAIPDDLFEFLGLFEYKGTRVRRIIYRAPKEIEGMRFLTLHGAQAPYYVPDPIAWAVLPHVD